MLFGSFLFAYPRYDYYRCSPMAIIIYPKRTSSHPHTILYTVLTGHEAHKDSGPLCQGIPTTHGGLSHDIQCACAGKVYSHGFWRRPNERVNLHGERSLYMPHMPICTGESSFCFWSVASLSELWEKHVLLSDIAFGSVNVSGGTDANLLL